MPTSLPPDYSKWPDVKQWRINDAVPYGTYEFAYDFGEGYTYSASYDTLMELRRFHISKSHNAVFAPAEEVKPKKVREEVLDEAGSLITGDREEQYGSPSDHFSEVASALNSFGFSGPGGREIKPVDVPFFQLVVKLSRILKTPGKRDSWVDIVGYGALGYEVAIHE